jgi:hypothetical protein
MNGFDGGWTMINVVSSFLIVALFAFWVRDLKHQILGLQKLATPLPAAGPKPVHTPNVVIPAEHKASELAAPAPHRPGVHRTREGNVPVWTIE